MRRHRAVGAVLAALLLCQCLAPALCAKSQAAATAPLKTAAVKAPTGAAAVPATKAAGDVTVPASELDALKQRLAETEKLLMDVANKLQALLAAGLPSAASAVPPPLALPSTTPAAAATPVADAPLAPLPKELSDAAAPAPEPQATAVVPAGGEDDYANILALAYLFYEGQMSGDLPAWNRLLAGKPGGYKKPAHLKDGADIGKDLSGGFYDAGDYLKCPHALAWTMANLALSMMEFRDAHIAADQWDVALRLVKWGMDWLVKAHIKASDSPSENAFVAQISARPDHWYFGRPELATNPRPVYIADANSPGADLASEYAAAYAAGASLFKGVGQSQYADMLFRHAKQAYGFAKAFPKNYKTPAGVFQAYSSYWPDGYTAQYAWAAAWMCRYSSESCSEATETFNSAMRINNMKYGLGYDYDAVMPGVAALLTAIKLEPVATVAKTYLEGYVLAKWEDTSSVCPKESYANVCYTPKGLAYYSDWGTLRNTGNMMFLATLMAKHGDQADAHMCWARSQMRYITGTSTGKSYVIGYGPDQPKRPHHRQSACAVNYKPPCRVVGNGTCCAGESGAGCCNVDSFMSDRPATIQIKGGLVGGPDQQDKFPDIRNDYQRSEVAMDFNAGFTAAAAGLTSFAHQRKLQSACSNSGTGAPACTKVADYTQCGGAGDTCPAHLHGTCVDGPWKGYCCPAGQTCQRNNQWFWICKAAVPQ